MADIPSASGMSVYSHLREIDEIHPTIFATIFTPHATAPGSISRRISEAFQRVQRCPYLIPSGIQPDRPPPHQASAAMFIAAIICVKLTISELGNGAGAGRE